MSNSCPPVIIIPAFDIDGEYGKARSAKYLVSSLLRNFFKGKIVIGTNAKTPIFKVGRADVREIGFGSDLSVASFRERDVIRLRFIAEVQQWIDLHPKQWVVVMEPSSLILRSIDHLFPEEVPWNILWTGGGRWNALSDEVRRVGWGGLGFLAMRGKAWRFARQVWRGEADIMQGDAFELKVSGFEWGEAVQPECGRVDWPTVDKAAMVSMAGWGEEEIRTFTRCLYLGKSMGSEMEVMLQIIEF